MRLGDAADEEEEEEEEVDLESIRMNLNELSSSLRQRPLARK